MTVLKVDVDDRLECHAARIIRRDSPPFLPWISIF